LSDPRLARLEGIYALADDDPRWPPTRSLIDAALEGGACAVQLRLKRTSDRDALALARWAAPRCHDRGALLVVNDRFDLADLSGADGVHLGQEDVSPGEIPAAVRARLLIGLSTHDLAQVEQSTRRPVDYVAFGPVFGTRSKTSAYTPRGAAQLADAVKRAGRPLVAIGGIDLDRIAEVRDAGAAAAAVISAIAGATDPAAATRVLRARFERGA
jgi:thiamine-phosphate pyrophosphorylase